MAKDSGKMREEPALTGSGGARERKEPPEDGRRMVASGRSRSRPMPLGRLLLYYVLVAAVMGVLAWFIPLVRDAFFSPIEAPAVSQGQGLLTGGGAGTVAPVLSTEPSLEHTIVRTLTTLLVVMGALTLALPVAWVYMHTKRLRYDASLVQSVIILPVVVAGILMVVRTSLALAFALAGIVGAVRFRNTLKDPKDLIYIFLAIGLGIASGVQALDISFVLSLAFNVTVLTLWKFNVGAIYSREYGPRGILSVGDSRLMVAQTPESRRSVRKRLSGAVEEMKTDGILLVHTSEPEPARHAVEVSLSGVAKDWKLVESSAGPRGLTTLHFLVKMKKKAVVVDLLGELDDRWAAQVAAAEFIPMKSDKQEEASA